MPAHEGHQAAAVANAEALEAATSGSVEYTAFHVTVQKKPGATLGIDVTYNSAATWTRHGVFIARIFEDGLIADWNKSHEDKVVCKDDFIFQVNCSHSDPVTMIQEMKTCQTLTIHIVRRTISSAPPTSVGADCARPKLPHSPTPLSVDELFGHLMRLDNEACAGVITVVLERNLPSVADEVLGRGDGAANVHQPELVGSAVPAGGDGDGGAGLATVPEGGTDAEDNDAAAGSPAGGPTVAAGEAIYS